MNFGSAYLQDRLAGEFPLARHIGIVVDAADDAAVILRAPLAPNANHKGTAFGGSLYSLAVLTAWSWVTRYLAARGLTADAVIQESNTRFLAPVQGELRATAAAPPDAQIDKFHKMLRRAGRGRIGLQVQIHNHQTLATLFDGVFVAVLRNEGETCLEN